MEQYLIRTRHDQDAYRTYAKVHVDARGGGVMARAVGVLLGLFILAGGVIATVYAGFRLLYVLSILIGLAVIFGRPLAGRATERNRAVIVARRVCFMAVSGVAVKGKITGGRRRRWPRPRACRRPARRRRSTCAWYARRRRPCAPSA